MERPPIDQSELAVEQEWQHVLKPLRHLVSEGDYEGAEELLTPLLADQESRVRVQAELLRVIEVIHPQVNDYLGDKDWSAARDLLQPLIRHPYDGIRAYAQHGLGTVEHKAGHPDRANRHFQVAHELYGERGDERNARIVQGWMELLKHHVGHESKTLVHSPFSALSRDRRRNLNRPRRNQ